MNPSNDADFDPENDVLRIPLGDILDLHSVPPRDTKAVVEEYLYQAYRQGFTALRIIHGKGIGAQRETVRRILSRTPYVQSYQDAPMEAGGWGATIVTLSAESEQPFTSQSIMTTELEQLLTAWDSIQDDARLLTRDLTPAQLLWRPQVEVWSVAQCLDHLIQVDNLYAQGIEEGISRGRRDGVLAPIPSAFRLGWLENWFVKMTGPPPRLRLPAPKLFRPAAVASPDPAGVVERFHATNRRLAALTASAAGLDLIRIKVTSPVSSRFRFSLLGAFRLCAAHDRRHLYQARQLIARATAAGAW